MNTYQISVNQLADFGRATESGKRSIIKQQLVPSLLKVPKYQLAKARIKKFFQLNCDLKPIMSAIDELKAKTPDKPWKVVDKKTSIEALERFIKLQLQLQLPKILKEIKYEVITTANKSITIDAVDVIVAPDIIIKGHLNGKAVIGAIKIHISHGKQFNLNQAQEVAAIIYKYLKTKVAKKNEEVRPEFCFCIDVFSNRLVSAPYPSNKIIAKVTKLCKEVVTYWDKVVTIELPKISVDSPDIKPILALAIDKPKSGDVGSDKNNLILKFWPGKFAEASHMLRKQNISFYIL